MLLLIIIIYSLPLHPLNDLGKDSTDYYRSEGRNISINFYDFWLDASDYSEIPKSAFQSYRACFIFEKYLMHGASRTVPITTNVIDECSEVLFGGGIMPQEVDSTLYEAAMNETIEFITSEVNKQTPVYLTCFLTSYFDRVNLLPCPCCLPLGPALVPRPRVEGGGWKRRSGHKHFEWRDETQGEHVQ